MYTLPPAVDIFFKMYSVPSTAIPAGSVAAKGFAFLQFNNHRVGLLLTNQTGTANSVVWVSERENGFADAFPITVADLLISLPWPPRNPLYCWQTVAAPDFRYTEMIYQPTRQGVQNQIRSNVQYPT